MPIDASPAAPVRRMPVAAYLAGVLVTQVANNAMHLVQPLMIAKLSGSLSFAAFFSSVETAIDMSGTFVGGWPADRFGSRRLTIAATLGRALCLAAIPIAWCLDALTLPVAIAAYALDSLMRGFADTGVHALPLELSEGEREELKRLNARYELVFDFGAVAGPAALSLVMIWLHDMAANAAIPAVFALGALAYALVPTPALSSARRRAAEGGEAHGGPIQGLRAILAHRRLLLSSAGLAVLNIYPLRKLFSAFFAKAILGMPAYAGWVGAVYGFGGVAGSLIYEKVGTRGSGAGWVALAAAGVLVLAVAWIPGAMLPMFAAILFFSVANVGARLSLTCRLQEDTPLELGGGVMAVVRWAQQLVSMSLKLALGAAFAMGASPRQAFALLGGALSVVAVVQLVLAWRLSVAPRPESPAPDAAEPVPA